MKHSLLLSAGLAAWLAAAGSAALANGPLTLAQAQRLAVERSRQVAAYGHAEQASREMSVAGRQLPDPVLSLSLENVPAQGPDRFSLTRDSMTMQRVGVMQELTSRDKRAARGERFEAEAAKAQAERENTIATIQRDTAIAWLDTWYAEAMAAAVAEARLLALQEAEAADTLYRTGRGTQADVFMARSGTAMVDDRADEIERRVRNARTMLARWTGDDDPRRPLGQPPSLDELRDTAHHAEALAGHPEIVAMSREVEVARAEAKLAGLNRSPDWSVEVAYQKRGSAYDDMFTVGVKVPLPWDRPQRQDRELSAKLAEAERLAAQRDEALRRHEAEVRVMANEWGSNRERLVRYEREIVPLAASRAEAALTAYRTGKGALNEVLSARRAQLETRIAALQLANETARLWAQLNFLFPGSVK